MQHVPCVFFCVLCVWSQKLLELPMLSHHWNYEAKPGGYEFHSWWDVFNILGYILVTTTRIMVIPKYSLSFGPCGAIMTSLHTEWLIFVATQLRLLSFMSRDSWRDSSPKQFEKDPINPRETKEQYETIHEPGSISSLFWRWVIPRIIGNPYPLLWETMGVSPSATKILKVLRWALRYGPPHLLKDL